MVLSLAFFDLYFILFPVSAMDVKQAKAIINLCTTDHIAPLHGMRHTPKYRDGNHDANTTSRGMLEDWVPWIDCYVQVQFNNKLVRR